MHAQRSSPLGYSLQPDLDTFARAFENEKALIEHIATLLRKMGRRNVRITHGKLERGKDIVFYGPSGIDEDVLYACVVKNKRIRGSVDSTNAAKTVLSQAEQAQDEAYINPETGEEEFVKAVYVISPFDIPDSAMLSISGRMRQRGTVRFICGRHLLELFAKHWESFLLFESDIFVSYLLRLQSGLSKDSALLNVLLRKSILDQAPREFERLYIQPAFYQRFIAMAVGSGLASPVEIPPGEIKLSERDDFLQQIVVIEKIGKYLVEAGVVPDKLAQRISPCQELQSGVRRAWSKAYREFASRALAEFKAIDRGGGGGKGKRPAAAPKIPSERIAALTLEIDEDLLTLAERVDELRLDLAESIAKECEVARGGLRSDLYEGTSAWIQSNELATMSRLYDLEALDSNALGRDEDSVRDIDFASSDLRSGIPIVMIVGPAGFGKTSFCKWHALHDAERILASRSRVLPIYVPLHRLASYDARDAWDFFVESADLRKILDSERGRSEGVRLYLDGLDEVPDRERQRLILGQIRSLLKKSRDVQVVLTSRDHVVGPWFDGIPRIRVRRLDEPRQSQLVRNWLESDESTARFFDELSRCGSLRELMGVPLLATLIIAVYKKERYLPPNRTALYSLFVELLCGGWDAAKGVNRARQFGVEDKRTVLRQLAGTNQLKGTRDARRSDFSNAVRRTLRGLIGRWQELLEELVEDGLLLVTTDGVRFSHLSIQEFLAAEFLEDPAGRRPRRALNKYLGGSDWWLETMKFYIARSGKPADVEEWLVASARSLASRGSAPTVVGGELDRRLGVLRESLRLEYPAFVSSYPADGVEQERTSYHENGEIFIGTTKRSLTGRIVEAGRPRPEWSKAQ